jgi:signal transduction histidine kinase/CheY-like chemotaxis protein/AraC-like DNA-binding protein/ligand-binding sensor domain-containing protein
MGPVVFGQNDTLYSTISMAQGLSQGMIFDIIQDRDGFLWIGTKNGLNRYDGYGFKVFTNDPYNPQSLSSNTVIKLFEDSQGRVWVGTDNAGINVYDKTTGAFYRIMHDPADSGSLSGNGIKAIEELEDGRFLVATDKAGLNLISLPADILDNPDPPDIMRLSLPDNSQVWGMGKDSTGAIWIGSMNKMVFRLDAQNLRFVPLPAAKLYYSGFLHTDGTVLVNHNLYLDDGIRIIPLFNPLKFPEGNILMKPISDLWDFFHRELDFYAISRWEKGKKVNWNEKLPLDKKARICYPYIIDKSGIMWSGSVGYGLRKYQVSNPVFTTSAADISIRRIIPTASNDLYFVDYGYTWWFSQNGGKPTRAFTDIPSLKEIDNLLISSRNTYWIKSDKTGYSSYDPVSKVLSPHPDINKGQKLGRKQPFLEDSKGNIWLPGQDGFISIVHPGSGKTDSLMIDGDGGKMLITALLEDNPGQYWVGTENGMAKIVFPPGQLSKAQVVWYRNDVLNRNSLNYNLVSCFLPDPVSPETFLWIATRGGGLNKLNKTTGEFVHVTTKTGLPDNVVYGILADAAGNIWGSTNKGLFCMKAAAEEGNAAYVFRNFTKAQGLQDDEFNTGAYAALPDGRLAFGGVNGYNVFEPAAVLKTGFTPAVFITSILVGNQTILPKDETGVLQQTIEHASSITLQHDQDILTLEFSSLDFSSSEQNKYRYQLKGVDPEWIESGNRRSATYLHLPAGTYVFRVQGSNSQGVWSEKIAELTIRVKPPWWLSWWAYVLYVLLFGFLVRSYLHFRVNKARLESQLHYEQEEANRIKELDAIKTHLYANITHEFRTPLTVILGMANQIKASASSDSAGALDMITRNGENLLNLVNQMLDLAKLENRKMTLQLKKGDIIAYLRYIVESFQSMAVSQQKQFHFLPETDELVVEFDPEKIRQIFTNLFSNALKFTPASGNVYVRVHLEDPPENGQVTLVLKVKDTGIGIPEDQIPFIFDRFYQTDNSYTRKAEGTGIGLALTRELVRLMNGSIAVRSPPTGATRGTEFIITLPLSKADDAREATVDAATHPEREPRDKSDSPNQASKVVRTEPAGTGPVVLLVEDNADVVAYTVSCLPEYSLAVGNDGQEGFDIATEIIPDLIITDVMMPVIDGLEMCRRLRSDPRTSHIPIIMLTARADMSSKLEGLVRGADVYLEKPFHKDELLIHIQRLIEQRKKLHQYYSSQLGLLPASPDTGRPVSDALPEEKAEHAFVVKVRELVEANFSNPEFSVEHLCKLVYMSHSQLHRKLDALAGYSPNQFIRMVRLRRAKELLTQEGLTIAHIAQECGYNDPGYFTRVFRQELGCTPQEWRTNQRREN